MKTAKGVENEYELNNVAEMRLSAARLGEAWRGEAKQSNGFQQERFHNMITIIKRYEAAPGAKYNDDDAQLIGQRLEKIGSGKFKDLTPHEVVEDARKKSSPLHNFFTWNNGEAAEKYRVWEARHMLSTLRIVIIRGATETEFKAFHNIRLPNEEDQPVERVYRPALSFAKSPEEARQQVIDQAKQELESWRRRYTEYSEFFGGVFAEIDRLLAEEKAA